MNSELDLIYLQYISFCVRLYMITYLKTLQRIISSFFIIYIDCSSQKQEKSFKKQGGVQAGGGRPD